jgi:hypothetical protein
MLSMPSHTTSFERITDDAAVEIVVDFTLVGGSEASGLSGPPEHYDPGEAPEFVIEGAYVRGTDEEVALTPEEEAAVERDVMERIADFEDRDDYPEDY